jgi:Transposase.
MKKKEDLELHELALSHLVARKHKSLDEKRMIVRAYLQNHVPITQLSKEFGIRRESIYHWIRTFADGKVPEKRTHAAPDVKQKPSIMPKRSQKPMEAEAEELARLREENKRLAEALKMAEWMNHAKDVMIDEAEKMFNIPIRKKAGAKQ